MSDLVQTIQSLLEDCDYATPGPWFLDMGNWEVESRAKTHFRYPICPVDPGSRNGFENIGDKEEVNRRHAHEHNGYVDGEFIANTRTTYPAALKALLKAVESLERVKRHGCCVMHNDSRCPGCEAVKALTQISAIMAGEKKE